MCIRDRYDTLVMSKLIGCEDSESTKRDQQPEPTVGFSSTPTLYKLHWQDDSSDTAEEYVHCGADLLLNGLNRNLDAHAQCPVCGTTTRLLIADGKIDGLEPRNALIHVLEIPTKSGRIWVECEATHIFDKKTCLEKWVSEYKGKPGLVSPLEDYHNMLTQRRSNRQKLPEEKPKV